MRVRKVKAPESPPNDERYIIAKADAQSRADATGIDHGLEWNPLFKSWSVFMLPGKKHSAGHELRCERVYCSDLSKCLPGHGPNG